MLGCQSAPKRATARKLLKTLDVVLSLTRILRSSQHEHQLPLYILLLAEVLRLSTDFALKSSTELSRFSTGAHASESEGLARLYADAC